MVENYGTMEDGPVPVFVGNLLLCELGTGNMDKGAPGVFNDTVGALSFGRGCGQVPDQDVPFDLILWYTAKKIPNFLE